MTHESITKCPKCGKAYENEYDRLGENGKTKTKHLQVVDSRTFESAWGTEHEWVVNVACECGTSYNFTDST